MAPTPASARTAAAPPTAATLQGATGPGVAPLASASLTIDFRHSLRSGFLSVFVDEQKAFEEELSGRITSRVLGFERRRGHLLETLAVQPGRRRIRAEVWPGKRRSASSVATFKEGATRRLVVSLYGLTKSLSLDLEKRPAPGYRFAGPGWWA
jgi:hypothetical protein